MMWHDILGKSAMSEGQWGTHVPRTYNSSLNLLPQNNNNRNRMVLVTDQKKRTDCEENGIKNSLY